MSLQIALTDFISFSKSSSLQPRNFKPSIYSNSALCTWCPQSPLFRSCGNGIHAIQKSNGDSESPWYLLLFLLLVVYERCPLLIYMVFQEESATFLENVPYVKLHRYIQTYRYRNCTVTEIMTLKICGLLAVPHKQCALGTPHGAVLQPIAKP
jgi:hypothetical protein